MGHALKKVIQVVADQQGRELTEVGKEAGAEVVCGTSLKAALDQDWDQLGRREEALSLVLKVLQTVETWVQTLQREEWNWLSHSWKSHCKSRCKMCKSMRKGR